MLTELVALTALVLAGYGAYIAHKWDRRGTEILRKVSANLQGETKTEILESAVQVLTATGVNVARLIMLDERNAPLREKLEVALKAHGPELASAAAKGYLTASRGQPNPGRELAQMRWGPTRGTKVPGVAGGGGSVWDGMIESYAPVFMERAMAGMMGGGGSGAGASLQPQTAAPVARSSGPGIV